MRKIDAKIAKNGYYLYMGHTCLFIREKDFAYLLFKNKLGINWDIEKIQKLYGKQFKSYHALSYETIGDLTLPIKLVPNNTFFKKLYPNAKEQGKFLEVPYVF